MKLYAISDLHVGYEANRRALDTLPAFPGDWLIVAGDVGETEAHLDFALAILTQRFAQVLWAPGNHELWTVPGETLRGEAKYRCLVAVCRKHGVLTPEDAYPLWPAEDGPRCLLAPLFILYDYSFRPAYLAEDQALAWAEAEGVVCADELLLHPDPYPSRSAWCAARCDYTEQRLREAARQAPLILINHFPLRFDLAHLPALPRFSIWCGTRRSEDWHLRYPVIAVVYGHLHIRNTQRRDGIRFEEVSLGYPRHWRAERGMAAYLRQILP